MARARKTYTPEFKLAAVAMIAEQELSVAEVGRRLGVAENRLHTWKKVALQAGAGTGSRLRSGGGRYR